MVRTTPKAASEEQARLNRFEEMQLAISEGNETNDLHSVWPALSDSDQFHNVTKRWKNCSTGISHYSRGDCGYCGR